MAGEFERIPAGSMAHSGRLNDQGSEKRVYVTTKLSAEHETPPIANVLLPIVNFIFLSFFYMSYLLMI